MKRGSKNSCLLGLRWDVDPGLVLGARKVATLREVEISSDMTHEELIQWIAEAESDLGPLTEQNVDAVLERVRNI